MARQRGQVDGHGNLGSRKEADIIRAVRQSRRMRQDRAWRHVGCLELWRAVFEQAIHDARCVQPNPVIDPSRASPDALDQRRATAWFLDDSEEVGSFLWICGELDITASGTLSALGLRMRAAA